LPPPPPLQPRQAISFSKAKQTEQWGTQGRAKAKSKYDRKSIEADLMELIARENRWDRELEASGYTPDLSLIYEVLQHEREETLLRIAVRPDKAAQRPQLVGGQILTPEASGGRAPVYIGAPPRVRIPLVGRAGLEEELARWRVTVRSKWTAIPERRVTVSLAEIRSEMDVNAGTVDLPLRLPSLLGDGPCGNFMVRVRGPLGRDAEFTLRIIPHLVITHIESINHRN